MRRFIVAAIASLVVAAFAAVPAAATPTGTGASRARVAKTPQFAAPGFTDSAGFANAEDLYANPDPRAAMANGHAVSQYDVACFQLSSH